MRKINVFIVITKYFKIKTGNKFSETEKWIDVSYKNRGDFAQMLSNLFPYSFKFRGKRLNSIESFFQGIKFKYKKIQKYVFSYYGTQAVHVKVATDIIGKKQDYYITKKMT